MIDIRINRESMTVIATGHAGADRNDHDHDLVCCAVSALLQALVFTCQRLPGVLVSPALAPGDSYIHISPSASMEEAVRHRLTMFSDALEELAKKYPDNLRIK